MAVTTDSILQYLTVVENVCSREVLGLVDASLDTIFHQAAKEQLCHGVVTIVVTPTHAGYNIMIAADPKPVVAAVLGALI